MNESFSSIYAPIIEQYLKFKRGLGYVMKDDYFFRELDDYFISTETSNIGLTRQQCDEISKPRLNMSKVTRYKKVNSLRSFSIFLNDMGFNSYVPPQLKEYQSSFTPYIFTEDEIIRFFEACDSIELNIHVKARQIYPACFRLIYGCGLREMEALSLRIGDVNFSDQTVLIRNSKNGEDRLLPMSDSLTKILYQYANHYRLGVSPENYFFAQLDGHQCSSSSLYKEFRRLLFKANIPHRGKGKGPRLHDFRHSFSVHSLAFMSDAGLDLYFSLPLLSKYLGHRSLEATEKYVRLTANMYPGILSEVNNLCQGLYPEVIQHETD